jgi:hypothetical protein
LAANGLQRLPPLEHRQNRIQDPLDVAIDFVVVKAGHSVAMIAQELLSRLIAVSFVLGRMSRAVDLHHKLFFAANEVGEIWTDRLLPNELEPAEKAVSKSPPKLALCLSLVLAQFATSPRFVQT